METCDEIIHNIHADFASLDIDNFKKSVSVEINRIPKDDFTSCFKQLAARKTLLRQIEFTSKYVKQLCTVHNLRSYFASLGN